MNVRTGSVFTTVTVGASDEANKSPLIADDKLEPNGSSHTLRWSRSLRPSSAISANVQLIDAA